MRISDWSSDVCSSDLRTWGRVRLRYNAPGERGVVHNRPCARRIIRQGSAVIVQSCAAVSLFSGLGRVSGESLMMVWRSRSEEHTSALQSLLRISYAVFCLQKKTML